MGGSNTRRGVMIFDGNATIFSTCRDCRQIMTVIDDATVHPTCTPKPTKLETLTQGWLSTVLAGDTRAEELTAREIEDLETQPPQLHRTAVAYAKAGWPVFPLGVHSKKPAIPKNKGGNGLLDATTDYTRIDRWWKTHPHHNIGLATGRCFDVIDIDPRSGGVQSFLKLLNTQRLPNIHGVAVTASGGMHLYVKPTRRGNHAGVRPGIDYRGLGGYVVAPPSTLGPRGRSWAWMTIPSPIIKGSE